jgi:PPM family protein phosphatase
MQMTIASVFAVTDPGVVRLNNEDSVTILRLAKGEVLDGDRATVCDLADDSLVLAVSDGMGGANAGEVASALTVEALREHITKERGANDADVVRRAIEHANAVVRAASLSQPDRIGMGATVVAAVVNRARATVAVVGDSRAYVLRLGRLAPLTRDQTFVQALVDSGVLLPDQAATFPQKSVILQAIGTSDRIEPTILELSLRRGDRLLLCSDGLTSEVCDHEIAALLGAHDDARQTCRALVAAANAHGGEDNISVAVAFIDGDDLPPPSREDVPPSPPPSGRFLTSRTSSSSS